MKNYFKTSNWLRWTAAGVFGAMLVFNIMISLDFDKNKLLPSLTLVELGNMAFAQESESSCIKQPTNVSCESGGPGSSECSVEVTYPGGMGKKYSVTCTTTDGCYACCWADTITKTGGANCFK